MKIPVRLFAAARELAGEVVEVSLIPQATIADLRTALCDQFPQLANLAARSVFAVGTEYADDTLQIPKGADVACIPPVSGG